MRFIALHALRVSILWTSNASGAYTVAAYTLIVCTTHSIRRIAAGLHLHATQCIAFGVCCAGNALHEEISGAAGTLFDAIFGTIDGLASDALGTFTDLLGTTLTVCNARSTGQGCFSESVTVSPFRTLVVGAKPI